ncbi:septal ring lytic transglycosylase RlpA family protein [Phenylobacterium sp.]|uniref:septal ring lytic transglycosylase RlpA family protein n=1 Tax=Phenylobacterium sp. TaxID=1871053 RepID=UPI0025DC887C|nr:septal ring lytic transglycosylase RlpA family protein [Phenylobacterium sp.]
MTEFLKVGRVARIALILAAGASVTACVTPRYPSRADGLGKAPPAGQGEYKVGKPYQVGGIWYVPREQPNYDERGIASWYGDQFHQKATANGETFDMNAVTAAHTTLPLPSMVEVTNLDNGKKLVVRVNDRGPFVDNRIIDLSREAARQLGYDRAGLANVRVRYVGPAPLLGPGDGLRYAQAKPLSTRLPPALAPLAAGGAAATSSSDDAMTFAAGSPPPRAMSAVARPADDVTVSSLPPITGSAISNAPIAGQGPVMVASAPVASLAGLRIQAGAFSSQANAQRAVAQLSSAGTASIEPLQRDGLTLYRVVLPAPQDEAAAYALRDRVAEIGFAEARVVRSF